MGYIVAIGGGTNGGRGTEYQTELIDKKIVELTNKANPRFLFIGFATTCPDSYYRAMKRNYKRLGCVPDTLNIKDAGNKQLVEEKFDKADIIYIGGGNTLRLMREIKKYGITEYVEKAFNDGKVVCGISAGAIALCKYGNSDSQKYSSGKEIYIKVTGMGLVDCLYCPHFDVEPQRYENLERMMKTTYKIPAISCDNCAAIITDGKYAEIITSSKANVNKFYFKNGEYIKKTLTQGIKYPYCEITTKL